jgi:hypothetical protein
MQPRHPQDSNVDWSLVLMLAVVMAATAFLLAHLV